MSIMIDLKEGAITGGNFRERFAMRLCLIASFMFTPFKLKGFWRATKIIGGLFNIQERQWVKLSNGVKFSIDLYDPYWNRMLSNQFKYEPELIHLLATLKDLPYSFIDCGANMGYWSCLAASPHFGQKSVFAIEPLSDNFQLLKQHVESNKQTVNCFKKAISDQENQDVPLFKPGSHASVSLVSNVQGAEPEEIVQTITLDRIYHDHLQDEDNILLKLDVEGMEILALKGSQALLTDKMPLVLYEDHSDDKTSEISDFVLNKMGYKVLYIDEQLGTHKIENIEQVNEIKVIANHGYNFLAFHPESNFAQKMLAKFS